MNLGRFDERGKLIDAGKVSLEAALQELASYRENASRQYRDSEEGLVATCFQLSRSAKDFIQVNCDGPEEIWFRSDRLVYDMGVLRKMRCKQTMLAFGGNGDFAKHVLADFYGKSRDQFEMKYAEGYCEPARMGYARLG